MMMRGHDNLSVNDQMEDLRERMRLLQGDRKVRNRTRDNHHTFSGLGNNKLRPGTCLAGCQRAELSYPIGFPFLRP